VSLWREEKRRRGRTESAALPTHHLRSVLDEQGAEPYSYSSVCTPQNTSAMYVFGVNGYLFCTLGQCLSPPSRIRMYANRTRSRSTSLRREDCEERAAEMEEEGHSGKHTFADERFSRRAAAPSSSSAVATGSQ
jgi:hypothetical protein